MRKVVVLNQFALPRSEGGGTRHIDLFSRITGWQPLILAGNRNHYSQKVYSTTDDRFLLLKVPYQDDGFSRVLGWLAYGFQAFVVVLFRRDLDLVYGSTPQPIAPLVGLLAAKLRGKQFILEVRDLWPESLVDAGRIRPGGILHKALSRLERFLVRNSDLIVAVTLGWQDHFEHLGMRPNGLVVIPNGADLMDFRVTDSKLELRQKHSITSFTAVFAGAHGPKDGLDLILDAAVQLPHVHFLLVGEGSAKRDAVCRAQRESLNNVEFREPVTKRDLPQLLKACDLGIHAVSPMAVFNRGMSPNKLFDYMASGLPVVSNAEQALSRIAASGEIGQFGNSSSLVESIQKVVEAPNELRAHWGNTGRRLVDDRFSRREAADRLAGIMNQLIDSSPFDLEGMGRP